MSKNKCSFCYTQEEDRIYWKNDEGTATMCGNCCLQYAKAILEKQERDGVDDFSADKNEQFQQWLVDLEDKWMEKNVINSHILEAGGVVNEVHFRFEDEGDGYYFVCELEVENIDSLPDDIEENVYNEIEWAFDGIRDELAEEGLDLDQYLGEKLIISQVDGGTGTQTMSFDDWDGRIAEQGVELDEVAESLGITLDDIEKWRSADEVPAKGVKFLLGLEGEVNDL